MLKIFVIFYLVIAMFKIVKLNSLLLCLHGDSELLQFRWKIKSIKRLLNISLFFQLVSCVSYHKKWNWFSSNKAIKEFHFFGIQQLLLLCWRCVARLSATQESHFSNLWREQDIVENLPEQIGQFYYFHVPYPTFQL